MKMQENEIYIMVCQQVLSFVHDQIAKIDIKLCCALLKEIYLAYSDGEYFDLINQDRVSDKSMCWFSGVGVEGSKLSITLEDKTIYRVAINDIIIFYFDRFGGGNVSSYEKVWWYPTRINP